MTEMPEKLKIDSHITKRLCEIVGEKNATDMKHIRYAYSYDLSFVSPKLPDYVVMPTSVEQVQEVMKFANQEKISVTPFTAGTNIGGLCIPENGGILLDMKRMNQIIRFQLAGRASVSLYFFLFHQSWYRRIERPVRPQQRRNNQYGSGAAHRRAGPGRLLCYPGRCLAQLSSFAQSGRSVHRMARDHRRGNKNRVACASHAPHTESLYSIHGKYRSYGFLSSHPGEL